MGKCNGYVVSLVLGLPMLAMFAGCANTLVFTTGTTFGLDISQRPDQTINVTVGYDRTEVASIPAPPDSDASESEDTYSVLGIFDVRYGNPWKLEPLQLHQFFTTGMAARTAVNDPRLQKFFGQKAADIVKKEAK